ncbi:hypothetical protein FUA26_10820 [Seonamhaeicola algicola]|uniref:Transporter n=2 Tax=Seonamhaeicola TaxID=1649495 RepID=A0A5C7AN53_9FLAO|nr:hypothetical protein FUA26_10820 [Seonamhaeicola algicola]
MCFVLFFGKIKAHNGCLWPYKSHTDFGVLCDLCSCSTSSGSMGFGTLNNANFVGLRYIYQKFESQNGVFQNSPKSEENFNTYQLWAQIPINNKYYVTANLPYQDLTRSLNETTQNINGVGDANIIAWYKLPLIKKKKNNETVDFNKTNQTAAHTLLFGLGVKLPTGKFEEALTDNVNPGFQVGTGSFDGIFSAGYNYAGNKIGVNTLLSYYLKGENKNEYKFGDQVSFSTNVYTVFKTKKINIMPFLGLSGDSYSEIKQYNETLNDTNGTIVNTSIGTEVNLKAFVLGVNFTAPIHQDLFGGNVQSKNRLALYLNYSL